MRKSTVALTFTVIVLSVLLVISTVLDVSGYYYSLSYLNSNSDLVVGEDVSIGVKPNQTSVVSFTFDGGYLPDEVIPQVIQINAQDLNSDVRVRVKAKVFGIDYDSSFDFVTTQHFEKAVDNYYYYDGVLQGGNKITFCNYIVFPSENDLISKEKYILSIIVETLENKYDVDGIWKNVQQM